MATSFVDVDDLADRLQTDFDTDDRVRAWRLLQSATAVVQREARQQFTTGTDTVITLQPTGTNLLLLPELPVTAVSSVVSVTPGASLTLVLTTDYLWTSWGAVYAQRGRCWNYPTTVTYSHGYATVPEDVCSVVLDMACRAWQNPRGVLSEQIGTYSARYPNNVTGLTLLEDERMLMQTYRPRPG